MAKVFAPSELIINEDGSCFHLHLRPEYLAEVKNEQTQAFSPQSVQRRVYSPMLNQQKGIISQYDHLFKRYASVARTDWRLLAAMSYQEP